MSEPTHEITWTVTQKHFRRLDRSNFEEMARDLRLDDDWTEGDVIEALYESRNAEELLMEMASDRNWIDTDEAEMVLDNKVRAS
jgi:hypothetical protein